MSLEFRAELPERRFRMELTVERGETLVVLGPNGAGKSTLLGTIAGLLRPSSGRAVLNERLLFEVDGGRGRWAPPYARNVSLLAQEPLLFPHLTARDNVAFGPRSRGAGRREARMTAMSWLEDLEAGELADRRPNELSGGQAQRVAVARALAADPELVLLDEPMAALDVAVAPLLRRTLRRVLRERTVILVTHDVLDAYALGDRVAIVEDGGLVELGPIRELLGHPRNAFSAALVGVNLLLGEAVAGGLRREDGELIRCEVPGSVARGMRAGLTVAPQAIRVSRDPSLPGGGDANSFLSEVRDIEPRGDRVRIHSEDLYGDVSLPEAAVLDLVPGARAWFSFRPEDATMFELC